MSLRISTATDYGIRAMLHIASLPDGVCVRRVEIAAAEGVPTNFMAKVLRRLVRHDLLRSARGLNGGFTLARRAEEISMLAIVEAIDGPIDLTPCMNDAAGCERSHHCPASLVWPAVGEVLRNALAGYSLEQLVSAPRRNGRIAFLPERYDARISDSPGAS